MEKKIKILCIPGDNAGCGRFREIWPHKYIQEHYSDYFDVDIRFLKDFPNDVPLDKFLSQYDIVHMHKQLDKNCEIARLIKFLGIKLFVDVDDHWDLGNYHPMSITAKKERWDIPIIEHLKLADYVTTTTEIFANVIKKYNKNVLVYPNAIDPTADQFKPKNIASNRIRFGLICGSSHYHDFLLLQQMTAKLPKEYIDKIQFVLCGFDTNGTRTIHHLDTGQIETRPILPQESVWYDYEKIITDNYKIVSPEHKRFLELFMPQSDYQNHDEAYRRIWTKDIEHYADHYNNIDVLLVPLKNCPFNNVKSQLKVIEAAFFHKAIIASNTGPYTIDLKPMIEKGGVINESGNALLVDESKTHKQWTQYVKYLVDHPEMITKLQDNLANDIVPKYNIDVVTKERAQKYLEVMGITDVVL